MWVSVFSRKTEEVTEDIAGTESTYTKEAIAALQNSHHIWSRHKNQSEMTLQAWKFIPTMLRWLM